MLGIMPGFASFKPVPYPGHDLAPSHSFQTEEGHSCLNIAKYSVTV